MLAHRPGMTDERMGLTEARMDFVTLPFASLIRRD